MSGISLGTGTASAGCSDCACDTGPATSPEQHRPWGRVVGWGVLVGAAVVIAAAAVGERLGWFDAVLDEAPWPLLAGVLLIGGWPVFKGVLRAALRRRVTSHTLMTLGVVAAAGIGEWTAAILLVFFMRFGDWMEAYTTDRSRAAIRSLADLAPRVARRLGNDGTETEVPVEELHVGDLVVVRPGERIPVDGTVTDGYAPVDQAPVTGESVPADKQPGDPVFAATICQAGALTIRTTRTSDDTTFARIIHLVEEAETHRAPVQRFADRFSANYIPVVLTAAALTLLLTGEVLRAVAVVVVACACAIVIATPIVVLTTAAAAARRGLVIKGGATIEALAKVDTLVVDKTGTLTRGQPALTDTIPIPAPGASALNADELLVLAAAAEHRSEHPLARAIVSAAHDRGLQPAATSEFTARPGFGVTARIDTHTVLVGNRALLADHHTALPPQAETAASDLEHDGKTVFFTALDTHVVGILAVADTIRPDVPNALEALQSLGITHTVMLTGDRTATAAALARQLGIDYRAELLPADKLAAIQELQNQGHTVLMVGDGINDAPALAAADVGAAMAHAGTDAALEAGHLALLREDWMLLPAAIQLARRATGTIRQNLFFTAGYNLVGIAAAAVGLLPPVWAAAAQSLPDMAIMVNSARILRTPTSETAGRATAPERDTATGRQRQPTPA